MKKIESGSNIYYLSEHIIAGWESENEDTAIIKIGRFNVKVQILKEQENKPKKEKLEEQENGDNHISQSGSEQGNDNEIREEVANSKPNGVKKKQTTKVVG